MLENIEKFYSAKQRCVLWKLAYSVNPFICDLYRTAAREAYNAFIEVNNSLYAFQQKLASTQRDVEELRSLNEILTENHRIGTEALNIARAELARAKEQLLAHQQAMGAGMERMQRAAQHAHAILDVIEQP